MSQDRASRRNPPAAFGTGALIGALGGLIGLGGAEFRLPLLISYFGFQGLESVILNKATSLVVVASALPFRARTISFGEIGAHWPIIVNPLAGSLIEAWAGAEWATRLKSETLYKIIAVLLVVIAGVLLFAHGTTANASLLSGCIGPFPPAIYRRERTCLDAARRNARGHRCQSLSIPWYALTCF